MTTPEVIDFCRWQILRLLFIFCCSQRVSLAHTRECVSRSQCVLRNGIARSQVYVPLTYWKLPSDFAERLSTVVVPIFISIALAGVAQLVGAAFRALKGHRFDSWSGHVPRLGVWSLVRVHTGGNQSMLLSLSLSPLPKINECLLKQGFFKILYP